MMRSRVITLITGLVAVLVPAGCSGSAAPSRAALPPIDGTGSIVRSSKSHPWLYVSGYNTNEILAYDIGVSGTPPVVETIEAGVDRPEGLAIDALGTVYAMNDGNNTVTAYAEFSTSPTWTVSVQNPVGVAVNHDNLDVWVITRGNPPSLFVYHKGQQSPYETITGSPLSVPSQIVFDAANNLYISDNDSGVSEILSGTFKIKPVSLAQLPGCPTGIAIDNHLGKLFVSGCVKTTPQYKIGQRKPKTVIDNSFPADNIEIGTYKGATTLFLPDYFSSSVYFYSESGQLMFQLQTPVSSALGVAYKRAGL